jgi:hypothetical protein
VAALGRGGARAGAKIVEGGMEAGGWTGAAGHSGGVRRS